MNRFAGMFNHPEEEPKKEAQIHLNKKASKTVAPYDEAWVEDAFKGHAANPIANALLNDYDLSATRGPIVTVAAIESLGWEATTAQIQAAHPNGISPSTIRQHVVFYNTRLSGTTGFKLRTTGGKILREGLDHKWVKKQEKIAERKTKSLRIQVRNLNRVNRTEQLAGNPQFAKGIKALEDLKLLAAGKGE